MLLLSTLITVITLILARSLIISINKNNVTNGLKLEFIKINFHNTKNKGKKAQ